MSYNICFIDFETTGIDLVDDHPIDFGACMYDVEANRITATYQSFIAPPKNAVMSKMAETIHGISLETAINRGSPSEEVLFNFFDVMGHKGYSIGGWNVQFDLSFLRRLCYEHGFEDEYKSLYYRHLDVQSFVRGLCDAGFYDRDLRTLNDVLDLFLLERQGNHSAMEDALLTAKLYGRLKHAVWNDLVRRFV